MSDETSNMAIDRAATAPEIGIDEAAAFLRQMFGDGVGGIEALRGGAWSSVFGFRQDGSDYVIRVSNHVDDFERDRLAHRFVTSNLPIPVVSEIGEAFGRHYAISQRLFGRAIDEVNRDEMRALLPSLFAMLDGLHGADLSGTSGYGNWGSDRSAPFASWSEVLLAVSEDPPEHRGYGWWRKLEESAMGTAAFEEGMTRLEASIGYAPEDRFLIHSDLLNRNMLVAGNRITGVLDWGCSLYGDFLYDLAWFVFWAPWYPQWAGIDFLAEAQRHYAESGLEIPEFEGRMRLCLLHIGLGHIAYNAWLGDWFTAEQVARHMLALSDTE